MTETAMGGGAYNVSWLSHIPAQDRPNTVLVMYDNKLFIIDGRSLNDHFFAFDFASNQAGNITAQAAQDFMNNLTQLRQATGQDRLMINLDVAIRTLQQLMTPNGMGLQDPPKQVPGAVIRGGV